MINLGLAGPASSGKDSVADYLVRRYGFVKYSFSDALYREVTEAFSLPDESLLRDRTTKEVPTERLSLVDCMDEEFIGVAVQHIHGSHRPDQEPLSPRQVLQWFGTEYRRAQDPDYWVKRADEWIYDIWAMSQYPEHRPQYFVNTSVRFENERAWMHKFSNGQVWHLRRAGFAPVHAHESEAPLRVLHGESVQIDNATHAAKIVYEREIFNNSTLDYLHKGVEQLLTTHAQFVRMEPMLRPTEPDIFADAEGRN